MASNRRSTASAQQEAVRGSVTFEETIRNLSQQETHLENELEKLQEKKKWLMEVLSRSGQNAAAAFPSSSTGPASSTNSPDGFPIRKRPVSSSNSDSQPLPPATDAVQAAGTERVTIPVLKQRLSRSPLSESPRAKKPRERLRVLSENSQRLNQELQLKINELTAKHPDAEFQENDPYNFINTYIRKLGYLRAADSQSRQKTKKKKKKAHPDVVFASARQDPPVNETKSPEYQSDFEVGSSLTSPSIPSVLSAKENFRHLIPGPKAPMNLPEARIMETSHAGADRNILEVKHLLARSGKFALSQKGVSGSALEFFQRNSDSASASQDLKATVELPPRSVDLNEKMPETVRGPISPPRSEGVQSVPDRMPSDESVITELSTSRGQKDELISPLSLYSEPSVPVVLSPVLPISAKSSLREAVVTPFVPPLDFSLLHSGADSHLQGAHGSARASSDSSVSLSSQSSSPERLSTPTDETDDSEPLTARSIKSVSSLISDLSARKSPAVFSPLDDSMPAVLNLETPARNLMSDFLDDVHVDVEVTPLRPFVLPVNTEMMDRLERKLSTENRRGENFESPVSESFVMESVAEEIMSYNAPEDISVSAMTEVELAPSEQIGVSNDAREFNISEQHPEAEIRNEKEIITAQQNGQPDVPLTSPRTLSTMSSVPDEFVDDFDPEPESYGEALVEVPDDESTGRDSLGVRGVLYGGNGDVAKDGFFSDRLDDVLSVDADAVGVDFERPEPRFMLEMEEKFGSPFEAVPDDTADLLRESDEIRFVPEPNEPKSFSEKEENAVPSFQDDVLSESSSTLSLLVDNSGSGDHHPVNLESLVAKPGKPTGLSANGGAVSSGPGDFPPVDEELTGNEKAIDDYESPTSFLESVVDDLLDSFEGLPESVSRAPVTQVITQSPTLVDVSSENGNNQQQAESPRSIQSSPKTPDQVLRPVDIPIPAEDWMEDDFFTAMHNPVLQPETAETVTESTEKIRKQGEFTRRQKVDSLEPATRTISNYIHQHIFSGESGDFSSIPVYDGGSEKEGIIFDSLIDVCQEHFVFPSGVKTTIGRERLRQKIPRDPEVFFGCLWKHVDFLAARLVLPDIALHAGRVDQDEVEQQTVYDLAFRDMERHEDEWCDFEESESVLKEECVSVVWEDLLNELALELAKFKGGVDPDPTDSADVSLGW